MNEMNEQASSVSVRDSRQQKQRQHRGLVPSPLRQLAAVESAWHNFSAFSQLVSFMIFWRYSFVQLLFLPCCNVGKAHWCYILLQLHHLSPNMAQLHGMFFGIYCICVPLLSDHKPRTKP